jgi:predicted alpha/beta superfamily hydrolase
MLFTSLISLNAQSTDTLFAKLDLTTPIENGWLNPDEEIVGLRGDQSPLDWGITFEATDIDKDSIYHAAIPFSYQADSLSLSLKIKIDGTNNPDDGWQKGRNHTIVIHRNKRNELNLSWDDKPSDLPSTITGQVEIFRDFPSKDLSSRDLYIYLPPGYEESQKSYPVLYMHDGQNLFDVAAAGQEWQVDEAAESLIKSGEIEPMIIVGIANTADRFNEYTPTRQHWRHVLNRVDPPLNTGKLSGYTGSFITSENDTLRFSFHNDTLFTWIPGGTEWQHLIKKSDSVYHQPRAEIDFQFNGTPNSPVQSIVASKPPAGGKGDLYGDFILNEVKPFIDENLRTLPGQAHTWLGGSSLGGLITMHLGLKHPDVFGQLLVVSPSAWWDDQWIIGQVNNLIQPTGQRIWIDMGTAEGDLMLEGSRALRDALIEKGWTDSTLYYMEVMDAPHNERAWAERFPKMLKFLNKISN